MKGSKKKQQVEDFRARASKPVGKKVRPFEAQPSKPDEGEDEPKTSSPDGDTR